MAVGGCHKESVEVCEIFVYAPRPAPANASRYTRLRFGLLASWWLPNPLEIPLWRALHVAMLVVGRPAFWALALLANFLFFDVIFLASLMFCIGIGLPYYVVVTLVTLAVDLVLFVGRSMRYCWSVVSTLACHAPFGYWRVDSWWTTNIFKGVVQDCCLADAFAVVSRGVPCMRGSWYMENKDRMWESWTCWWKEAVRVQEAVVL